VWENDGTDFEWIRNLGQRRGRDISHAAFWPAALSDAEIQAYTATSRLFDIVLGKRDSGMSTVLVSTYAGESVPHPLSGRHEGRGDDDEVYPVDMDPTSVVGDLGAKAPPARGLDTLELGASGNVTFTAEGRTGPQWAWPRRRRRAAA
jgi:hypothetical protein